MATIYRQALDEIGAPLERIDEAAVDRAVRTIAAARHVTVYAGGREGLQIRGFAMRLFHLGRSVSVVGDMTTPAIGPGDLFLNVCGPGEISTAVALVGVALETTWWALLALVAVLPGSRGARIVGRGTTGRGLVPVLQLTGTAELLYGLGMFTGLVIG